MRIDLRNINRTRLGTVTVADDARPTRVRPSGAEREVFLDWDNARDDAGHLRRCVACGSTSLYREKAFPQVSGIVVILAFAGAALGALGDATPPVLMAMAIVLALDVAIFVFARRRLVCYRCRSSYHDTPVAAYHRPWDRTTAQQFSAAEPRVEKPIGTRQRWQRFSRRRSARARLHRQRAGTRAGTNGSLESSDAA